MCVMSDVVRCVCVMSDVVRCVCVMSDVVRCVCVHALFVYLETWQPYRAKQIYSQ